MAHITNTCPKCGANMQLKNGSFVCSYCGAMVLNILEPKIDDDAIVMNVDDFAKAVEKASNQIVVKIDDQIQVIDADTLIANKHVGIAKELMQKEDYDGVLSILADIKGEYLIVERMRFLGRIGAKDEIEVIKNDFLLNSRKLKLLTSCGGDLKNDPSFALVLTLADDDTKSTYQQIGDFCKSQYDAYVDLNDKVDDVKRLTKEGMKDEALLFAKNVCREYPSNALSWKTLWETEREFDPKGTFDVVCEKMFACPDFNENDLPQSITQAKVEAKQIYKATHYVTGKLIGWTTAMFFSILFVLFTTEYLYETMPKGVLFDIVKMALIIASIGIGIWVVIKLLISLTKWLRPHIALIKIKKKLPRAILAQTQKESSAKKTLILNIIELALITIFTVFILIIVL